MKTTILFFFISISSFAQCLSGNCKDGFGKYDFGYATYQGSFKSGKPNGQGTMDYGGGDKFVGNFSNGQENGEGKLYKKNIPLDVTYINGKVNYKPKVVTLGSNAPKVDGCLQGDCYNGFGIIQFESGNRYEGNFEYGSKSGQGTFLFAGGNKYVGNFKDNVYSGGTFAFVNEGMTFSGTFYADGNPKTGKYDYPNTKSTVTVEDGKITKIDNPIEAARQKEIAERAEHDKHFMTCPKCKGVGYFEKSGYTAGYTTRTEGGAQITATGINHITYEKTVEGGAWTDYEVCSECKGKREIRR